MIRAWRSIRARLALLILASALPAALLTAALIAHDYSTDRERLENDTMATVRALAQAVERELVSLTAAAQVLATSRRAQAGDLQAFYPQAREVVERRIGAVVVLSDASGQQLLNTLRPLGEVLPQHGNPAQLRAVFETGRPVVSGVYTGGVLGSPVISVDVPVFRDGKVAYALSIGEVPERFRVILREPKLPAGWIGVVLDQAGTIVARTHEHARFVGKPAVAPLVAAVTGDAPEGALDSASLEGIGVVAMYSRSRATGWSVAVGVPREVLTAPLRHRSLLAAAAALAFVALGLTLAWGIGGDIARSVRALAAPAARVGRGEPVTVPPIGLTEADEVAGALTRASQLLAMAQHRAQHDALTGLANGTFFIEMARHHVALCAREHTRLALLFIDLDGFKAVNDRFGHDMGDRLLRAVAVRIAAAARGSDIAARLGGDEFALLLVHCDLQAARFTASKLVDVLGAPYEELGIDMTVSASIGIAVYPESGASAEALLKHADDAMYAAKGRGKSGYAVNGVA